MKLMSLPRRHSNYTRISLVREFNSMVMAWRYLIYFHCLLSDMHILKMPCQYADFDDVDNALSDGESAIASMYLNSSI